MPWNAMIVLMKATKDHTLPTESEPGRHRRGESISVYDWTGKPQDGDPNHSVFWKLYANDVPDTETVDTLRAKFLASHQALNAGRLYYKDATSQFQVGDVVTGTNSGTTGTVVEIRDNGDNTGELIMTGMSNSYEDDEPITSPNGAAVFDWFEGDNLGRKRVFVAISELPQQNRDDLNNNGFTVMQWPAADTAYNHRPLNAVPIGTGDPADDNTDDNNGITVAQSLAQLQTQWNKNPPEWW